MELWQMILLIAVALVVVGAVFWTARTRQRSQRLREHFGPEYDRAIADFGDSRRAEADLAERESRVRKLNIRPLNEEERSRFSSDWRTCQTQFVDDPAAAVMEADRLVRDIMHARGYPVGRPEDHLSDLSAAYPNHAVHYREARQIVTTYGQGKASTEDLRQSLVHYRALFDEILGGRDEKFRRAS